MLICTVVNGCAETWLLVKSMHEIVDCLNLEIGGHKAKIHSLLRL